MLYGVAIVAAIAALAATVWPAAEPAPEYSSAEPYDTPASSRQPTSSATNAASERPRRSIFRHSVVPGGVYSDGELRAVMRNDAVVAAHYETLGRTRLRAQVVPQDRMVYVSYRRGDDIYWTGKKVLLRAGEIVLTDGTTEVRARCGNAISETPLAPVADTEPDVIEFDQLAAEVLEDVSPETPEIPAGPGGGAGAPALVAGGPVQPLAPSGGAVPFVFPAAAPAPFVRWGGLEVPVSTDEESTPPARPAAEDPPANNPPSTDDPPTIDDPPVGDPPPADDPPVDPMPPIDVPTDPDLNPVPVPEPATYLLVGGGVAALLRRLRARTRRAEQRIDS